MSRAATIALTTAALSILSCGCIGRLFAEGMGSAKGASGRVVDSGRAQDFTEYKSLHIEPITVAHGLLAPVGMTAMIQRDLVAVAEERGLGGGGEPGLRLVGEIIHYETGSKSDAVMSPLEEVVLRAQLTEARSGKVVAETNLIGRSKATSSSGEKNLSAGIGKALDDWLKKGGLTTAGET